jgi:hypothetical protein
MSSIYETQFHSNSDNTLAVCCEVCNKEFVATMLGQIFCSDECYDKAQEEAEYIFPGDPRYNGYDAELDDWESEDGEEERPDPEPKPADFAPGKTYMFGDYYNGFFSKVIVMPDRTLKEYVNSFDPYGDRAPSYYNTWEEWQEYCISMY